MGMSKYEPLWEYVKENGENRLVMTYEEAENVLNFPIEHSFLTYKKELQNYGYVVKKISMKDERILFEKIS